MKRLFCDTSYFVALVNSKDQWHRSAIEIEPLVESSDLITTEEILIEFLNFYSESGPRIRLEVSVYVRQLLLNPKFMIVGRSEISFLSATNILLRKDLRYFCRTMNRKGILLEQLDECYDKNGWFVAVRNALEGVTAEQAVWKPEGVG